MKELVLCENEKETVDQTILEVTKDLGLPYQKEIKHFNQYNNIFECNVDMYFLLWDLSAIEYDIEKINKKIIYSDFPAPITGDWVYYASSVYFMDVKNCVIYYLYDNRGLDIIAQNTKSIKHLYEKYNDWVLDYDRNKIDALFKK